MSSFSRSSSALATILPTFAISLSVMPSVFSASSAAISCTRSFISIALLICPLMSSSRRSIQRSEFNAFSLSSESFILDSLSHFSGSGMVSATLIILRHAFLRSVSSVFLKKNEASSQKSAELTYLPFLPLKSSSNISLRMSSLRSFIRFASAVTNEGSIPITLKFSLTTFAEKLSRVQISALPTETCCLSR